MANDRIMVYCVNTSTYFPVIVEEYGEDRQTAKGTTAFMIGENRKVSLQWSNYWEDYVEVPDNR